MQRLALGLLLILSACTTQGSQIIKNNVDNKNEDKGPDITELVKANQEKWLQSQVKDPNFAKFNNLLVFGDSLSDPGNLNKRTLGFYIPPRQFYKSRFSNGPIWSDYAQNALAWNLSNYAVGGAETRTNSIIEQIAVPSFLQQISENKSELKTMDFTKTVVSIWIGPNNYLFNAVEAQDPNQNPVPEKLKILVEDAISDIHKGILKLSDIGFRHFILGTMPELGGINRNPRDSIKASDATLFAATAAHNQALRTMLDKLHQEEPELSITIFQAYEINQKTRLEPQKFGFTRLDTPCYIGDLRGTFADEKKFCNDPQGYKFWEYIHPNSKMHCYYASQFLADLNSAGKIAGFDQAKSIARCLEL
ncbi:MAG: SGNH/GDSL hydrolase family protein [Proteobacteria bacterium]|nr:SGNH/GDSL hydrolase family protein [Pseudomonadota bacterium]